MALNANTVYYTSLEANSFLLTYQDYQILVDPWLTSTLDFVSPRFSSSTKPMIKEGMSADDFLDRQPSLLVISQGLPDHMHVPTLKQLSKSIPVVAAPHAVPTLKSLGFQTVTKLPPGKSFSLSPSFKITATTGSVVGPPWQKAENGWLFRFGQEGSSETKQLYMEPHGNHPPEILNGKLGKIHGVITPVVHAFLPALRYDLVRGYPQALELLRKVKPEVAVVLMNHVSSMKGLLTLALKSEGTPEEFQKAAEKEGLDTKIIIPEAQKAVEVFRTDDVGYVGTKVKQEASAQETNIQQAASA